MIAAVNRSICSSMGVLALAACLVVSLAVGCKKEPPVPKADASQEAPVPSPRGSMASTNGASQAVVADSGDINATLSQLSLELRKYVVRTHKIPKDFDDFIAKSQVQAPAPPAGKKYAIQGQEIVMVKR
jgi:hypothetical protein